ncbi:MAG TPA: cellulase family glycosylhydrolase [Solirubrobacteraceae bacterium]|jgi:hypothetical protein|nr:cellulase family glycosylhydrolase [Solirubrobacteraceae bacterium]
MLPMRKLLCALLLCTTVVAVAATPALASHNELVYFEAPKELLNPRTRAATFGKLQALGVKALRVQLYWYSVAPGANSSQRPNFDATDPSAYNWSQYDPVLAEAQRLHWQVLLTVTSPVPKWATAGHNDRFLVTRPDPQQFEQFMTAVARHFGSQVGIYGIWNEPNHFRFLRPQFNANGTPASPRIYRGLYQAAYAGLKAAGLTRPKVLMGETAPGGEERVKPHTGSQSAVAPIVFLREMLCLNSHYRRSRSCEGLPATGYAHHAYANASGPLEHPSRQTSVTIAVLSRLTRALDLAARAGAIPRGLPVYLTEFGVQSKPNKYLGVPAGQQAEFDAIAERIAYSNPRVASFSQYLLRDDPLSGSGAAGGVGFQTGLMYANGSHKPLYLSWPIQLVVSKRGHGYSLWGLVRPASGSTKLTVLVQPLHSRHWRKLKVVTTNGSGYWAFNSSTAGGSWRVQWRGPTGAAYNGPPVHAY